MAGRRGIGAAVLALVVVGMAGTAGAAASPAWREPGRVVAGAEAKAARRRWALAKMDEMANEALRCGRRFQKRREVETCEAEFTRRFREYNEIYLEASRE